MKREAIAEEPSACILSLGQQGQSSHLPSSLNNKLGLWHLLLTCIQHKHHVKLISSIMFFITESSISPGNLIG